MTDSVSIGGWFFAADPDRSFLEQTVFWAPEAVPTIVPVRPALLAGSHTHVRLDLTELNESQFRRGPDGWHAVLYLRGVEHRIWLKEAPIIAAAYTVEFPFDRDFEFRVGAGMRLWRGLNGRPQGAPAHAISAHRRRRCAEIACGGAPCGRPLSPRHKRIPATALNSKSRSNGNSTV